MAGLRLVSGNSVLRVCPSRQLTGKRGSLCLHHANCDLCSTPAFLLESGILRLTGRGSLSNQPLIKTWAGALMGFAGQKHCLCVASSFLLCEPSRRQNTRGSKRVPSRLRLSLPLWPAVNPHCITVAHLSCVQTSARWVHGSLSWIAGCGWSWRSQTHTYQKAMRLSSEDERMTTSTLPMTPTASRVQC